ncbi:MAG: hypothetical protein H7250_03135 [Flavobacterium sp.]|nr:hypothetical protein [Flavobacterium sp.]
MFEIFSNFILDKMVKNSFVYYLILIFLVLVVQSCKKKPLNNINFIKNLSNDIDFNLPLYNESLMLFVKKNDTIYIKSLRELYLINQKKYFKIKSFDGFLTKVLNNDLLETSDLKNDFVVCFKLDKNVLKEFNEKGIENLKIKYCDNGEDKIKFFLKNNLNQYMKQNLMYHFFKNNYYIVNNCHSGKYVLIDKN